jgi:hypothetical protein
MKRPHLLTALPIVLAVAALGAALVPATATAYPSVVYCGPCHTQTTVHDAHATAVTCEGCHTDGTDVVPPPSACVACHPAAAIMAQPAHVNEGCFTTEGCHATPSPAHTPSETPSATPTPCPTWTGTSGGETISEYDEEETVGYIVFPTTGYPPEDGPGTGASTWLIAAGLFAAGGALLFAAWRLHAPSRRHD